MSRNLQEHMKNWSGQMNNYLEIERKFLVDWDKIGPQLDADGTPSNYIVQAYINNGLDTVRFRRDGDRSYITIKGPKYGTSCFEAEYCIGEGVEATNIIAAMNLTSLQKLRFKVKHGSHIWDVDVFLGKNKGLFVAEIELEHEDEEFEMPAWVGEEVSGDPKYYNSNLIDDPYEDWKNEI